MSQSWPCIFTWTRLCFLKVSMLTLIKIMYEAYIIIWKFDDIGA